MHISRDANLLGALGLLVSDRLAAATEEAAALGAAGPAAIVSLPHHAGCRIDELRSVVGLTHSGAVRLVDRLEAAGLLERRAGPDARSLALHLTPEGDAAASRILAARERAIAELLEPLDDRERRALTRAAERILDGVTTGRTAAGRLCRLCDGDACGHPERCPVTRAADRQEGRTR